MEDVKPFFGTKRRRVFVYKKGFLDHKLFDNAKEDSHEGT